MARGIVPTGRRIDLSKPTTPSKIAVAKMGVTIDFNTIHRLPDIRLQGTSGPSSRGRKRSIGDYRTPFLRVCRILAISMKMSREASKHCAVRRRLASCVSAIARCPCGLQRFDEGPQSTSISSLGIASCRTKQDGKLTSGGKVSSPYGKFRDSF
jgi:hypothetical protein